jgi:hypothetical protein
MFLRILVATTLLAAAVASAQETLWISDFEDVEPGSPDPTWSNPDFIVESIGGVNAYTAPWGYSGYSIYQTPVPAEHWLELRVRVDSAQSTDSRLDIIHRQGGYRVVDFGYIPSDSLFWATLPDAYCGAYYEPGIMEPGVWYHWLVYSEPGTTDDSCHLRFKWWREGDDEPDWIITREQYGCLDPLCMSPETEVSIVCTNASEFYVDWVEVRVPASTMDRPVYMESGDWLSPVFPNPANPVAEITYTIPRPEQVSLRVFNILGQEVAVLVDGMQPAGTHKAHFDGSDLPSGIYICTLATDGYSGSKKLVLMK